MENYVIFWLDGTTTLVSGESQSDALRRAGIGAGALGAIDFIGTGADSESKWAWSPEQKTWVRA